MTNFIKSRRHQLFISASRQLPCRHGRHDDIVKPFYAIMPSFYRYCLLDFRSRHSLARADKLDYAPAPPRRAEASLVSTAQLACVGPMDSGAFSSPGHILIYIGHAALLHTYRTVSASARRIASPAVLSATIRLATMMHSHAFSPLGLASRCRSRRAANRL